MKEIIKIRTKINDKAQVQFKKESTKTKISSLKILIKLVRPSNIDEKNTNYQHQA